MLRIGIGLDLLTLTRYLGDVLEDDAQSSRPFRSR